MARSACSQPYVAGCWQVGICVHLIRDRQRAYVYAQLEHLFPGMRQRYEAAYGERSSCASPNAKRLAALHQELCRRYGIAEKMPHYARERTTLGTSAHAKARRPRRGS